MGVKSNTEQPGRVIHPLTDYFDLNYADSNISASESFWKLVWSSTMTFCHMSEILWVEKEQTH